MTLLTRLGTIAMLPSKVVEEGAHAAAAYPWADELALIIRPGSGDAATVVELGEDCPPWVEGVVHHAPKIAGVVLGVAALGAVASGVRPEQPLEVAGAIAMAAWWSKLVAPERQPDREGEE